MNEVLSFVLQTGDEKRHVQFGKCYSEPVELLTDHGFNRLQYAKLKNRIAQLCEQSGIRFVESEESYTSKTSGKSQGKELAGACTVLKMVQNLLLH